MTLNDAADEQRQENIQLALKGDKLSQGTNQKGQQGRKTLDTRLISISRNDGKLRR